MDLQVSPNKTCRVCLSESDQLKLISAKTEDQTKSILESLHFVVNINISVEDRLPNQICTNCETDLYSAEAFKRRCLNSEMILSQKLQIDNKCEITEELSRKPAIVKQESPETSIKLVPTTNKLEKRLHIKVLPTISYTKSDENFSDEDSEPLILKRKLKIEPKPETGSLYEDTVESSIFVCKKETIYLKQSDVEEKSSSLSKKRVLRVSKKHNKVVTNKRKKDKLKNAKKFPIKEPYSILRDCILSNTNKNVKNKNRSIPKDSILSKSDINNTKALESSDKNDHKSKVGAETESDLKPPKKICPNCKKEFKSASQLKNHIIKVHVRGNLKDVDYECEICKATFRQLWLLNKHMKFHSEDAFMHICPECGKTIRNKYYLEEHIMRHQGVKPFQCDQCDDSFVTKNELIMHSRRHNGETPFSCEHCGRKFRAYSSLVRHRRTHTGERPYKCDMCPKSFAESGTRNEHRRIHTGEKPYVCQYCDRKFTKRHHLKTHLTQHGEPSYKKRGSNLLKTDT